MNTFMEKRPNLALLVIRIIIGGIFIVSGWMKVVDMTQTLGFFSSLHIPAFLTYIVAYGELIGGILLVIGLWTSVASAFLSIVMIVAIFVTIPMGSGAYMTPLATLAGLIAILGGGAGRFAIRR